MQLERIVPLSTSFYTADLNSVWCYNVASQSHVVFILQFCVQYKITNTIGRRYNMTHDPMTQGKCYYISPSRTDSNSIISPAPNPTPNPTPNPIPNPISTPITMESSFSLVSHHESWVME